MLLSNKYVRKIVSVLILLIFIISCAIIPTQTCNDKEKEVINGKEIEISFTTETHAQLLYSGVILAFNELSESSSIINVAYTQEKENIEVSSPVPETPAPTEEPVKLASNGKPYVYYEVYDFFYGSDKYHSLDYELQEYTYDLCIENGIEKYFTLILCQLYYESQYKTDVVSGSNDYGIAQINKCNHSWLSKELGITDFLDPKQSISCNIYMMSSYLKKYSVESSLFCYNTGSTNGSNKYSRNIVYIWNNGVREIKNKE